MVFVAQPFRPGRDGTPLVDREYDGSIGDEQRRTIVVELACERISLRTPSRNGLGKRKDSSVFFEPLDAEQFLSDRIFLVPRGRTLKEVASSARYIDQCSPSVAQGRSMKANSGRRLAYPAALGRLESALRRSA